VLQSDLFHPTCGIENLQKHSARAQLYQFIPLLVPFYNIFTGLREYFFCLICFPFLLSLTCWYKTPDSCLCLRTACWEMFGPRAGFNVWGLGLEVWTTDWARCFLCLCLKLYLYAFALKEWTELDMDGKWTFLPGRYFHPTTSHLMSWNCSLMEVYFGQIQHIHTLNLFYSWFSSHKSLCLPAQRFQNNTVHFRCPESCVQCILCV